MSVTDPIADMLTRIRNGGRARLAEVSMPKSELKTEIARVLHENGYIAGFGDEADAEKPTLLGPDPLRLRRPADHRGPPAHLAPGPRASTWTPRRSRRSAADWGSPSSLHRAVC